MTFQNLVKFLVVITCCAINFFMGFYFGGKDNLNLPITTLKQNIEIADCMHTHEVKIDTATIVYWTESDGLPEITAIYYKGVCYAIDTLNNEG